MFLRICCHLHSRWLCIKKCGSNSILTPPSIRVPDELRGKSTNKSCFTSTFNKTKTKGNVVYSMVWRLYIKDWVKYQLFCAWHENTIFGGIFMDNKSTTSLLFSKAEDFSTMKNILAPASNWQITNSCIRRVFKNPNFNLTPIIMPTSGLCVVLHVLQNEE